MNDILITSKVNNKYIEEIRNLAPNMNVISTEDNEIIQNKISTTDILVTYDVDLSLLDKAKELKWIHTLSAGVDGVPFDELHERNIILTNSKGIHKYQISEQVLGYMLMFERGLNYYLRNQDKKKWDRSVRLSELTFKSACILGVGSIGSEIARLCKAFGMKTTGVRNTNKLANYIDEIYTMDMIKDAIRNCDYVICALPLTNKTYHIIDMNIFNVMKDDAYFINIGRGKIVDEKSLINALKEKKIKGAAMDVFEEEPLDVNSPLWEMENVLITPHTAGMSPYYMKRAMEIFKHNLNAYLNKGDFINKIDLIKQY